MSDHKRTDSYFVACFVVSLSPFTNRANRLGQVQNNIQRKDNLVKQHLRSIAAGAALHIALADFTLRAAGRWSASIRRCCCRFPQGCAGRI